MRHTAVCVPVLTLICAPMGVLGSVYRKWMEEWMAHSDEVPNDHLLLKVIGRCQGHIYTIPCLSPSRSVCPIAHLQEGERRKVEYEWVVTLVRWALSTARRCR